jgi:hypothetical protein
MEPIIGILKHNIKRAEIVFIRNPDGDAAQVEEILDILEDDLEEFFFGCDVSFADAE